MSMSLGTDDHTLTQTHHSWVWVRNLFSQSKMVNIVIILNIIDTHTTTQDNPYPSLRVWVCMGMGMGRGENTHGLPMSHTIKSGMAASFVFSSVRLTTLAAHIVPMAIMACITVTAAEIPVLTNSL